MRRINRRLVLLLIVFACDVVSVFCRPQEETLAVSQLKDDVLNRYTVFATATPRSLESTDSYSSASKNQYASNMMTKNEDTRYAEPDPSLRPFFQFLLNSSKRKKRYAVEPSDSRLVQDFINYSINDLRHPVRVNPVVVTQSADGSMVQSETQYLPVSVFTKNAKPANDFTMSGSLLSHQMTVPDPHSYWQETPLIFPDSNKKPQITSNFVSSNYYPSPPPPSPQYDLISISAPPLEPTFITPIEYQGPTFVTPISITQEPPPTIVILEDIETVDGISPQNDPIPVQQDPGGSAGGSGGSIAAAVGAGAGIAAAVGAGAGISGIVGGTLGTAGIAGGAGGAGGAGTPGGDGGGVTLTPVDAAQCRAIGDASNVCSELITTSSSSPAADGPSPTVLDGFISLLASINIVGPLVVSFWAMLFPPMSIILTSGLGVISFMFPWLFPRLWFGRQLRNDFKSNRFDQRFNNTNIYHQPYYY